MPNWRIRKDGELMFIDYISLMLINMSAGLILLAWYLYEGFDSGDQKKWVSGFAATGAIALVNGLHMTWNWPLPASYNVAFGEMSVLYGILFLCASLSLAKGWDLSSVGVYAFFAGLTAVIIGIRIVDLKLTQEPGLSGIGFILSGSSGMMIVPVLYLKNNKAIRLFVACMLVIAALIWLRTGYKAYWGHLGSLAGWKPLVMR